MQSVGSRKKKNKSREWVKDMKPEVQRGLLCIVQEERSYTCTTLTVSAQDVASGVLWHCSYGSSLHVFLPVFTCRPSGFQRTFLSRAGVELRVFWGLFFSVRMTPHGSSLRALTRFFSCQPTWGAHTPGLPKQLLQTTTHIHTHTDAVDDALGKLKLLRKTTTH